MSKPSLPHPSSLTVNHDYPKSVDVSVTSSPVADFTQSQDIETPNPLQFRHDFLKTKPNTGYQMVNLDQSGHQLEISVHNNHVLVTENDEE